MNIKIIRHFMTERNNPAVEYERVTLWGAVGRGIRVTDGLKGQALLDDIEKHGIIADKFSMSGEVVDEMPVGSIEWRWQQDYKAGAHRPCPRDAEVEAETEAAERHSHSEPKPPKHEKAKEPLPSASASIPTQAAPMHAQER